MYENKPTRLFVRLPFVLGVLLFKLFPFVMSFALSFTQYDVMDPPVSTWALQNYKETGRRRPAVHQEPGRDALVRGAGRAGARGLCAVSSRTC